MGLKIIVGDTLKIVRFKLQQRNVTTNALEACDLTDCTLQTKYRISGGTEKTKSLSIVGLPTAGIVELAAASGNWDAEGVAVGRIYVTSVTKIGITWRWELEVEAV